MEKNVESFVYKILAKDYTEVEDEIKNYDYVSFDIFDTLIKRNVYIPSDIFDIIERKTKINGFKEKRIKAECIAKKKSKYEEISLKDIYNELDINDKENLYNLELETELNLCTTNKEMLKIYNYCLENDKKIFITSDMYLPKDIIEKILKNNGFDKYDRLYLSNDYKLTKYNGNLFKKILKENNIPISKIIHIGDSIKADYLSCKKLNIKSILIKRNVNNTLFASKKNESLDYNILSSFINNHVNAKWDEYEKFGYEVFGPILYSFTSWLHEKIKEDKIEKIYFLARDAKIIMNVYEKRFKEKIPMYYLHASRRAMILSSIDELNSFDDVYNKGKSIFNRITTVKDMFNIFLISDIKYPYGDRYINTLTLQEKEILFNIIKKPLEKVCKIQNSYLKKYLTQNDFYGNIAIVDIGWNGTTQYNIEKLANENTKIFGYYYGIYKSKLFTEYKKMSRSGFLFDDSEGFHYQSAINLSLGIFETMFLSNEKSTIGYKKNNDLIVPIYNSKKDNSNIIEICKVQDGARKFVSDIDQSKISNYIYDKKIVYFENYNFFSTKPTLKNINIFKNIKFTNINEKNLINDKSLFYYIFHLKNLYLDFFDSCCKIMFVKDVFKIDMPYFKILERLYIKDKNKKTKGLKK